MLHSDQQIIVARMFTCAIYFFLLLDSLNACTYNGLLLQAAARSAWPPHRFEVDSVLQSHHAGYAAPQMLMAHSQPLMGTSCISMSACCFLSLWLPTYMVI
ncbi:hypothetical protein ILYODFUR_028263 [Ilyodon furcidens]|uniref:Secreted protein n=1 Tax=Ilyodon furcidens TaxID=33524 RepID=A0ABV0T361_9TELE